MNKEIRPALGRWVAFVAVAFLACLANTPVAGQDLGAEPIWTADGDWPAGVIDLGGPGYWSSGGKGTGSANEPRNHKCL